MKLEMVCQNTNLSSLKYQKSHPEEGNRAKGLQLTMISLNIIEKPEGRLKDILTLKMSFLMKVKGTF